ncbi:MAG: hypothetical protein JWR52_3268 [Marmoricola sp.]|nr:hypothetical protein [Marmoricola sp.]
MTAHEIHALSGAYAVDALDEVERARFEAHLAECADCRAEVTSLQAATTLLSGLSETAPPPELRSRVLADIKTVRPLPPTVARITERRPRRWTNLLAAAAVIGAVGGGTAIWQDTHQGTSTRAPSAIDRVLEAADVQKVSQPLPHGASATVFRSKSQSAAVLVTHDLPGLPAGHVYELWFRDQHGTMVPAGLMAGGGNRTVLFEGNANNARGVGVTVEPAGGSKQPTTIPVALLNFEQTT